MDWYGETIVLILLKALNFVGVTITLQPVSFWGGSQLWFCLGFKLECVIYRPDFKRN